MARVADVDPELRGTRCVPYWNYPRGTLVLEDQSCDACCGGLLGLHCLRKARLKAAQHRGGVCRARMDGASGVGEVSGSGWSRRSGGSMVSRRSSSSNSSGTSSSTNISTNSRTNSCDNANSSGSTNSSTNKQYE